MMTRVPAPSDSLASDRPRAASSGEPPAAGTARGDARILLADDSPVACRFAAKLLRDHGYRVEVALDAETPPATTDLQTLGEVMLRVRPRFHRGLVAWYRDAADPRGLSRLETLFRKVHAGLGGGILADLFGL
jgi:hypothetical protein